MKIRLTASEAARSFSDVVNRVVSRGEEFIVERNGEAACQIAPVNPPVNPRFTATGLIHLLRSHPAPDPAFWDDVESAVKSQGDTPGGEWLR